MSIKYDQKILDICNSINEQIIDAYNMYKANDFYRAMDGSRYSGKIKEFFMKRGVFAYILTEAEWSSSNKSYVMEYINENGTIPRHQNSSAAFLGKRFTIELKLKIYKKNDKIIETIDTNKTHAATLDKFFLYCAKNYLTKKEDIEDKLKVLADLPNDIKRAYEEFKNPPSICSGLENEIKGKLDAYKQTVNLMDIYRINPRLFLEKLNDMEQKEREEAVRQVLRLDSKQANTELDRKIAEEFPDLAATVFRKGVGRR